MPSAGRPAQTRLTLSPFGGARMGMDAVKPGRLAETVADHLERLILEGTLRPGERLLAERDLAANLDIPRPSRRDALAILEGRGLVRSEPNGRTVVDERLGAAIRDPLVAML